MKNLGDVGEALEKACRRPEEGQDHGARDAWSRRELGDPFRRDALKKPKAAARRNTSTPTWREPVGR